MKNRGWGISRSLDRPLTLEDTYPCPICERGHLNSLALMESMGCDRCGHLFTLGDPPLDQCLQVMGSPQPLLWHWVGSRWRLLPQGQAGGDRGLHWGNGLLWGLGLGLVGLPTAIVGLGCYCFPLLPDAPLAWFPWVWLGLTFCAHGSWFVLGLVEYYQVPRYVSFKLWLQQQFSLSLFFS